MSRYGPIAIINASKEFSPFPEIVASLLKTPEAQLVHKRFPDGERNMEIKDTVRGRDVYVFQCYQPEPRERWDELLYTLSAVNSGGGASRVNVVMPYCFGSRGERQTESRQSVPLEIVVRGLYGLGVDNVIAVCLHTDVISTIFRMTGERKGIRVEHLPFEPLAANYIVNKTHQKDYSHIAIASPDAGGAKRAQVTLDMVLSANGGFDCELAIGHKVRKTGQPEVKKLIGDVRGRPVFLYDDIGDTHGSIEGVVNQIKDNGATELYLILAHPTQGDGHEVKLGNLLKDRFVKEVVYGNSMPLKGAWQNHPKVRRLVLEPFVAQAISNMNNDSQMSALHEYQTIVSLYEQSRKRYEAAAKNYIRPHILQRAVRISGKRSRKAPGRTMRAGTSRE